MVLFKLVAAETFLFASSIYIPLWSYSNVEYVIRNVQGQNLHSTMVLFKFATDIFIPSCLRFTFHYGPIQI